MKKKNPSLYAFLSPGYESNGDCLLQNPAHLQYYKQMHTMYSRVVISLPRALNILGQTKPRADLKGFKSARQR
jgi:hypothetical protein